MLHPTHSIASLFPSSYCRGQLAQPVSMQAPHLACRAQAPPNRNESYSNTRSMSHAETQRALASEKASNSGKCQAPSKQLRNFPATSAYHPSGSPSRITARKAFNDARYPAAASARRPRRRSMSARFSCRKPACTEGLGMRCVHARCLASIIWMARSIFPNCSNKSWFMSNSPLTVQCSSASTFCASAKTRGKVTCGSGMSAKFCSKLRYRSTNAASFRNNTAAWAESTELPQDEHAPNDAASAMRNPLQPAT
mmetsp:Transcript_38323/g.102212  ORF Transcript_38323/g.102212 Transcript_38323/m.102212 type:complete len:253 (-) Transcript_38323:97-855(-)